MTFCLKIYDDPLIFSISSGWFADSGLKACLRLSGGRAFQLIVVAYWHVPSITDHLVSFASKVESRFKRVKVHFMCASSGDCDLLAAMGLSTIHAHHNAFIDENIFKVCENAPKLFDAVHNAGISKNDFKRHNLAWLVPNICVITYLHGEGADFKQLEGYKYLAWCNVGPDRSINWLSAGEVCNLLCRARVGLILSEVEGPNFASGEYQFCGLPVITTPSQGGREHFLDPDTTLIINPSQQAVLDAVNWMKDAEIDPQLIRRRTIERAIIHRIRLLDWIGSISGQNVKSQANSNAWLPSFRDKLRDWIPVCTERGA